ncbi:MAG: uridine kinase [Pelagibacteraceae bacterium]
MISKNSNQLLEKKYLDFLNSQEVYSEPFHNKLGQLNNYYLPICEKIFKKLSKKRIKIIGLTGGQGAGKSTITQIIKLIFEIKYNFNVAFFSIDDFYKTLRERETLSKKVHPMFKTRGVPGTHDTKLLSKIFNDLSKKNFKPVYVPRFDKSIDDRFQKSKWQKISKKPDLIIFEGWCVGAKAQTKKQLLKPINILEKNNDSKLVWRTKVNNELNNNYRKIFSKIDCLIFLKVPNFECVYKWRLLQENKLKLTSKGKKIMSPKQVREFIMYYERITKQMLEDLGKNAYAVLSLDKKHRLSKLKFN